MYDNRNVEHLPYSARLELLAFALRVPLNEVYAGDSSIFETDGGPIRVAKTAATAASKRAMFEYCKSAGKEGITFKMRDAPYLAGRDGRAIKVKFWDSLSAIVAKQNDKRSVGLILLDNGNPINVGDVTIPPNYPVPPVGAVVEVRYLYAYPQGSLYQPGYLGERTDITPDECVASQRKFKEVQPEFGPEP